MNTKPSKQIVSVAQGLRWGYDGAIYQPKLDGKFATRSPIDGLIIAGELVGETFIAFDLLQYASEDMRPFALGHRLRTLAEVCREFNVQMVDTWEHGGAMMQALAFNGWKWKWKGMTVPVDGGVRKSPAGNWWASMEAAKPVQTFYCRVSRLNTGQSVGIVDSVTGEARGNVSLFGGKVGKIRIGSVLKLEGLCLTKDGKIRDVRPCGDTATSFLVSY